MKTLVSIAALAVFGFGAGTAEAADVVALISNDTLA